MRANGKTKIEHASALTLLWLAFSTALAVPCVAAL